MLVGSVVAMLFNLLPESALHSWGWRVPFLLSIAGSAVGYYIRRCAVEDGRVRAEQWGPAGTSFPCDGKPFAWYRVPGHYSRPTRRASYPSGAPGWASRIASCTADRPGGVPLVRPSSQRHLRDPVAEEEDELHHHSGKRGPLRKVASGILEVRAAAWVAGWGGEGKQQGGVHVGQAGCGDARAAAPG